MEFFACEPEVVPYGAGTATRIGRDLEADILVLEDGAVVARLEDREWVVNSSVDQYRRSLAAYGRDVPIAALEAELIASDPAAYGHPSSYWQPIIEYDLLQAD
ncbi:SUKH-4 family immunity protein [Solirubrobacter soli]|uniref:SUKH-4 family immunity protein n=1 Tax=Solirubrobacter soli TaxID=363832 RepID=UPI00041A7D2D|nr:SUKH-4 family immunity protein [Solirubrobacter soli]